ncbi:SRPBCC family protein [Diaminobutyricibacter sp. McL0608]|uniref:SRPBCC family protein n=1 Tax=Leifsonia sp. McL0608 TaxID=3143537 RepID=UPI0031F325BC
MRERTTGCMTGTVARITNTIDIHASAQAVYAALRDLDAYPSWLGHSMVYRGTRVGTPQPTTSLVYEDSTMVGRMRGELVEDMPDHMLEFHQSKPSGTLDALIRYTVDTTPAGTRLTRVGVMTTHGMLRVVQPMLLRMAAGESERTIKALKAYTELTK